jgi:hypothetical protein
LQVVVAAFLIFKRRQLLLKINDRHWQIPSLLSQKSTLLKRAWS